MTTDRLQLAMLGLDKHRQTLNAFVEQICPGTIHDHDADGFIIPCEHGLQLHLWAEAHSIQIRGKLHGAPINPTSPPRLDAGLMERCCSILADHLSQRSGASLDDVPEWARDGVAHELHRRAEALASIAGTKRSLALLDAVFVLEDELQRRGKVAPELMLPTLMEIGAPCDWVLTRPEGQRSYAGHNPSLRALQDAIHAAGATPYIRLDDGGYSEDDPPASLHLGWEVVRCEDRPIINALHGFVINPGPHTFDVLIGYLHGSRVDIIGGGPVASWCRARRLQK